jgi:hypothetical protein
MDTKLTKAQQRALFKLMIDRARVAVEFAAKSPEQDLCLLLTRDLPMVYSELPDARFCVLTVKGYKGSYRALHVFKSEKWVPLTAAKIFAGKTSTACASKKRRVLAAMRLIIKPQIDGFKATVALPCTCPLTGKILNTLSGAKVHVDHFMVPFSKIVEEWLAISELTFEQIPLARDGSFKDRATAQDFYAYHQLKADLKLVDKTANLRKGAKSGA